MTYQGSEGGRVENAPSGLGRVDTFWTWAMVEERWVEAMRLWRRAPDRERGWLTVRSWWPEIRIEAEVDAQGDRHYVDKDAKPRPLPLTRAQVAEMEAAAEWFSVVPKRDKRLVVLGLAQLAADRPSISWKRVRARLDAEISPRGLGMRYSRALTRVANALNAGRLKA